jgi:hypothetical protein
MSNFARLEAATTVIFLSQPPRDAVDFAPAAGAPRRSSMPRNLSTIHLTRNMDICINSPALARQPTIRERVVRGEWSQPDKLGTPVSAD